MKDAQNDHPASEPSLHEMQDLAGSHGIEFHGLHALNEAGVPLGLLKDAKAAGVNWWDIVCRLVADAPDIVTFIKKLIADAKAPAEANGNPDYKGGITDPEKPLAKKEQKTADKAEEKAEDKGEETAASHSHGHAH
jgi:hypothetical protein